MLAVSSVEEVALGGMARGSAWVRARVWGTPTTELGPWCDVEWRARLAIASELVGLAHRIIDLAADQVSARRQFGRPIASNQAVRFRLAEAYVEMVGAQALIAAAWQDRLPAAARWAKAAAGLAHDAVAKHAMQVCGAIGPQRRASAAGPGTSRDGAGRVAGVGFEPTAAHRQGIVCRTNAIPSRQRRLAVWPLAGFDAMC